MVSSFLVLVLRLGGLMQTAHISRPFVCLDFEVLVQFLLRFVKRLAVLNHHAVTVEQTDVAGYSHYKDVTALDYFPYVELAAIVLDFDAPDILFVRRCHLFWLFRRWPNCLDIAQHADFAHMHKKNVRESLVSEGK